MSMSALHQLGRHTQMQWSVCFWYLVWLVSLG